MNHSAVVRDLPSLWGFPALFRDSFFRDFERVLRENDTAADWSAWPRLYAHYSENGYEISAELPGLTEKDVELAVNKGVLTLSGKRALATPEGYRATRRERANLRFSRSVQLPDDVEAEQVEASLRDGVLRVRLPKRANVAPRKISITTGA